METIINQQGNEAKMFIAENLVDLETMKQIKTMIMDPSIKNARIMPDCHKGSGCCVGFTCKISDKVVPNFVGGDIGCGITSYKIGKLGSKEKKLDKLIRKLVPMGSTYQGVHTTPVVTFDDFKEMSRLANLEADNFTKEYKKQFNIDISKFKPEYSFEWFKERCKILNSDFNYTIKSMGTLGSGNHYIEINISELDNSKYITVHSGSRHFGMQVNQYHQSKIFNNKKFNWTKFNKFKNELEKEFIGLELEEKVNQLKEQIESEIHTPYLENEEAYQYFFDMIYAQKYAEMNRKIMIRLILNGLNKELDPKNIIQSTHNYIDFNDFILRKGAISAHKDELCIISLNMRDGILLCKGKGNSDWNYSSAHGSGRVVSRQKALNKFRLKDFQKEMRNVYSTSVLKETLDESPMAYKDSELIKSCLGPSVEIIEHLYPILNVKATK